MWRCLATATEFFFKGGNCSWSDRVVNYCLSLPRTPFCWMMMATVERRTVLVVPERGSDVTSYEQSRSRSDLVVRTIEMVTSAAPHQHVTECVLVYVYIYVWVFVCVSLCEICYVKYMKYIILFSREIVIYFMDLFFILSIKSHTYMFIRYSHEERTERMDNRRRRGKGTKKRRESNERRKENIN